MQLPFNVAILSAPTKHTENSSELPRGCWPEGPWDIPYGIRCALGPNPVAKTSHHFSEGVSKPPSIFPRDLPSDISCVLRRDMIPKFLTVFLSVGWYPYSKQWNQGHNEHSNGGGGFPMG